MSSINTARVAAPVGDSRRAPRTRTRISVDVDLKGRIATGRIHDLSTSGMCLDLDHSFFGPPGCLITVTSKEMGSIDAVVRWNKGTRIGVAFTSSSAASAQVQAYFRFFHRDKK